MQNARGDLNRAGSNHFTRSGTSAADRRVKVLSLTPVGARVRTALLERMTSSPPTLGRLSEADQRALARILRRLLE